MNENKNQIKETTIPSADTKPGVQAGTYEIPDADNVKQEVKELNNIGAPDTQY